MLLHAQHAGCAQPLLGAWKGAHRSRGTGRSCPHAPLAASAGVSVASRAAGDNRKTGLPYHGVCVPES